MLILKKSAKIILLALGASILCALLGHCLHNVFFDPLLNPNSSIIENLSFTAPITTLVLAFHLVLKNITYWYDQASTLYKTLCCAAFGFMIMLYLGLSTFGLNVVGVIYFSLSFISVNSFIPYFDIYLDKKLGLNNYTRAEL